MTGRTALLPTLAAIVAAAGAIAALAGPAGAQCRLCETPSTDRSESQATSGISLQVEAGLDFDRLVVASKGDGSATIRPDGSTMVTGTVAAISGRAMVGQARITGEAGRPVRIQLPRRIEMHSVSGGRITIEELISDLPLQPRLDPSGRLAFRFGGRLTVSGDSEGEYRGDIPITVEYL